jgi:hypothetical protein
LLKLGDIVVKPPPLRRNERLTAAYLEPIRQSLADPTYYSGRIRKGTPQSTLRGETGRIMLRSSSRLPGAE